MSDTSSTNDVKKLIVCLGFDGKQADAIRNKLKNETEDFSVVFKRIILEQLFPIKPSTLLDVYFGPRIVLALRVDGIRNVQNLVDYDLSVLWRIPGIGKKAHKEIEEFLLSNNFIQEPIIKK